MGEARPLLTPPTPTTNKATSGRTDGEMSDKYADAIAALEDAVDRACQKAIDDGGLTNDEIAKELERLAQGWRDAM